MTRFAAVAARNNRKAAARARDLATALRTLADGHTEAAALLEMAGQMDTAADAFDVYEPPVIDGITVTNTTCGVAGMACLMAMAIAEDTPGAGIPGELFYLVTEPITRRRAHQLLPTVDPGTPESRLEALRVAGQMHKATTELELTDAPGTHARLVAILLDLFRQHRAVTAPAPEVTADPAGVPHRTKGTCGATWRREPVNRQRPELGTTSQFGHPACGEDAVIDRFVKAAHHDYYRPVYACPAHARG
ncbi:hypothetical protein GR925_27305 [Streptomyces sp. HUCO-GS316]|uniref:hypothetical protein n=1 Tax=Streptomyces sp. HUCO-GS316 TaxID=2692198 RepID=UPI00136D30A0|nr:hypothetical protein [Streptomyces sp. HUCO-GS316]MXM67036.1 hypothetical protein [Streptomyces sp. HUCO-GS316]